MPFTLENKWQQHPQKSSQSQFQGKWSFPWGIITFLGSLSLSKIKIATVLQLFTSLPQLSSPPLSQLLFWEKSVSLWNRWEWGSGWGTHVNPWLIHVSVWQKPLQYCKVISPQLIKINKKKKEKEIELKFIILLSHTIYIPLQRFLPLALFP